MTHDELDSLMEALEVDYWGPGMMAGTLRVRIDVGVVIFEDGLIDAVNPGPAILKAVFEAGVEYGRDMESE